MPAIMIRPAVGSSENVSGRISATPATGPRPGSTPIAVPANAPTNAASKLAGVAATLNPYSRPWREFIQSLTVIPGWLEEPDPESRDSGFASLMRPGMTEVSKQPLPEQAAGHLHLQQPDEEPFEADGDRNRVDRDP